MRATVSARLRAAVLSIVTIGALAPALATAPARASLAPADSAGSPLPATSSAVAQAGPSSSIVTLITGDRVRLVRDAAGQLTASLTFDSPHFGKSLHVFDTPAHTWVVPALDGSVGRHLDPALFDVTALDGAGRVALKVTFDKGVSPHSLPGISLRSGASRTVAGRTTVAASYDAHRAMPAALARSLRGVAQLALAAPTPAASPGYELRPLTINVTDPKGQPLDFGLVDISNPEDFNKIASFGFVVDGQWKVAVPPGPYHVDTAAKNHVVFAEATVDDTGGVIDLPLAEATVQPQMTPPNASQLALYDTQITLAQFDEAGTLPIRHIYVGHWKVKPLAGPIVGSVQTYVQQVWTDQGYRPVTHVGGQRVFHPVKNVVVAKEAVAGIPSDLTFTYDDQDFADVAVRSFSTGRKTGPETTSAAFWGETPSEANRLMWIPAFPSGRPSVVHARYLGSDNVIWKAQSTQVEPLTGFPVAFLEQSASYRAQQHARIWFWRGPVTPMADRGFEESDQGIVCSLCMDGDGLHGYPSDLSSAGTSQRGFAAGPVRYTLYRGKDVVRRNYELGTWTGVSAGQHVRLVATVTPLSPGYLLSSHVKDVWRFSIPAETGIAVPILRADYVPPTNLKSVGKAGRVSYPISFDNLGPEDARVDQATVQWSVDDRHWHAAMLSRRDDNTFQVSYRNPAATTAHPYLSLKVSARDVAGRSISERVQHAYRLPRVTLRHRSPALVAHRSIVNLRRLCRTKVENAFSCYVKLSKETLSADRGTATARGLGATDLRSAYGIGDASSARNTVAVLAAYDYPTAAKDMNVYRKQYGLPACTAASGCFRKLNQSGERGHYPQPDGGWTVEAALDLQMVSAACPTCHIILVEADEPLDDDFFKAEQTAVDAGATVTNHSFGHFEGTGDTDHAQFFTHPGVTAVASSGDGGFFWPSFPASSPDVMAVGGTTLARSSTTSRGWTEKAWSYAGSGCSAYFDKPAGQNDPACQGRTTADVAAVARGLAIYDSSATIGPAEGRGCRARGCDAFWLKVSGTSASSPFLAGMIAAAGAGGMRPSDLYSAYASSPSLFHDIVGGYNGFEYNGSAFLDCHRGTYMCSGVPGYDGPTGLGTPVSLDTFAHLH